MLLTRLTKFRPLIVRLTFARATLKAVYLRLLKMLWIKFCADCVDDCGFASVEVAVDGLLSRRLRMLLIKFCAFDGVAGAADG